MNFNLDQVDKTKATVIGLGTVGSLIMSYVIYKKLV